MVTIHDAIETCADDTMAVQRTAAIHERERKPEKLRSSETLPRAAAKAKALGL